jgi:hypothetical protein
VADVILLAVGWYLRFSYRNVGELRAERTCTPITSLQNHKKGHKSAWFEEKYSLRLMPELYEYLDPMPFDAAAQCKRIWLKIFERTVILSPVALRIGSTPWVRWAALWKGQKSCPFTVIAVVLRTATQQASNPIKRRFGGQDARFSFARSDARLIHAALPRFSTSG